ncbi:MAG: family 10 glycosylhydrolase [Jaaginema sp. PMC 1079.18]|nr:family 10 glycosylhydrolase [Jaaginema sp. PMC 1079.18]
MPKIASKPYGMSRLISSVLVGTSLVLQSGWTLPGIAQTDSYCRLTSAAISEKETLRRAAFGGNEGSKTRYQELVRQHAQILQQCRSRTWPQTQAIWLRLYPCDTKSGVLESVLDHVVNKGYNQIHVEVFFNSQVLLPENDNPTPWSSVVRSQGAENVDLLAQAIAKGHERGLKVYAWAFTMNFGYNYGLLPDRQSAIARNGKGQNSLDYVSDGAQLFIDPYHPQAQRDFNQLTNAIARRRPDGVLFDYIRYPRGSGAASVAANVKDLWIYGSAAQQSLIQRGLNRQGSELIQIYLQRGTITAEDVAAVRDRYPNESTPNWQGRNTSASSVEALRSQLWTLSVAHAAQGVIDFLNLAARPVQSNGIPAGAVFFPTANIGVGQQGYDSRLQPWDRFSPTLEWHPMAYAVCGSPNCIVDEVRRVVNLASPQTKVMPALAGYWGRRDDNRPSLESQMQAIRQAVPQIKAVSHFAYSWQEPQSDRARRFCEL